MPQTTKDVSISLFSLTNGTLSTRMGCHSSLGIVSFHIDGTQEASSCCCLVVVAVRNLNWSSLNEIKKSVFPINLQVFLSVYFCFWMGLPFPIVFYGLLTRWICEIICENFHLAFKIAVNLVRVKLQWTVPFYLKSGSMLQLNLLCNIIRIFNMLIWLMCASAGSSSSG